MSAEKSTKPGIHTHFITVRWSDFDRHNHIMNANYVELAQEARLQFAEDYFYARDMEFSVFVRRIEADYLRPILPDTTVVRIETQVVEIGNTSFVTRQEIFDRQNKLACAIECVQVAIDMEVQRPRSLTQNEIRILTTGGDLPEVESGK